MKELSIEQKAKAYDEVREKIAIRFGSNVAEEIFSEYEESEDERIRKAIIDIVNARCELYKGITKEMFLAWLEKQGENNIGISEATKQELENNLHKALEKETPESLNEFLDKQGVQKPADKVEPKFHEGDIIIHKELGGDYIHNPHKIIQVDILDEKYRLECGLVAHFGEQDDYELVEQKPADTEKGAKGNKVEIPISEPPLTIKHAREVMGIKQDDAWSKEDEKFVHGLIRGLSAKRDIHGHTTFSSDNIDITKTINWLKSLRERYTWKPSDEQIKVCKEVYADILSAKGFDIGTVNNELNRLEEELKKLREE